MDFNIETRKKQLNHLDQLISSCRERVESVVDYLGWTTKKIQQEDAMVQCPINPNHTLPASSWQKHVEKCVISAEGYSGKEEFLSEPPVSNTEQTIHIDRNKKIEIFTKAMYEKGPIRLAWNGLDPDPRTSDRLVSTFSTDERLCLYEYSVANTKGPPEPPEFTTWREPKSDENNRELSTEELLARERDAKRRRIKYRAVHLNRKTQTEVMREVIEGQMREYEDWLVRSKRKNTTTIGTNPTTTAENNGNSVGTECDRPGSSISRHSSGGHSNGRSRLIDRKRRRSRSRSSRRRRKSRSRSRERHRGERRRRSRSRERRRH